MKMNNFLDDWNFHFVNKTLCFQPLRVGEIHKLFSSKNLQSAGDGWWSWILEGDHRQKGQTQVRSHVAWDICSLWNSHFRRRHPLWPCHWKWLWLHQGDNKRLLNELRGGLWQWLADQDCQQHRHCWNLVQHRWRLDWGEGRRNFFGGSFGKNCKNA